MCADSAHTRATLPSSGHLVCAFCPHPRRPVCHLLPPSLLHRPPAARASSLPFRPSASSAPGRLCPIPPPTLLCSCSLSAHRPFTSQVSRWWWLYMCRAGLCNLASTFFPLNVRCVGNGSVCACQKQRYAPINANICSKDNV
jgi:hypothetical protein